MPTQQKTVLIRDLNKFDINNVTISDPTENRAGFTVAYVNYTDPDTGATGTPQFLVKGRWRVCFDVTEFKGKWYVTVDSQINSMFPEKSHADKYHQQLYDILKSIDELCEQKARANPGMWMGDDSPPDSMYVKGRNSVIKPSASKVDGSRVKVADGNYCDNLKFSLPTNKDTKEHFCKFYRVPADRSFDTKDPECHTTVDSLVRNVECNMVLESNNVWLMEGGKYGHAVKAKLIKVFENTTVSADAAAMLLDDDSDDEEEEAEVADDVANDLGDGSDSESESDEEELQPAPRSRRGGRQ